MPAFILGLCGLTFLAFGLGFMVAPERLLGTLGPLTATPDLLTDLRAIYGGLNLGLGIGLLAALGRPALHRPALALTACTLGAVAVGRMIGVATTGFERDLTAIFLALESVGAAAAAVAWNRTKATT
ncbi:MAG: DUF4345 family protein [bacterium]